jgi:hypothetical protein
MWPVLRSIGLVFLGVVIAAVLILGSELLSARIFHFMDGVNLTDREAVKEALPHMPIEAFLVVLVGYFIGTFCGAWLAARLTRIWWTTGSWQMAHAMSVGLVILFAGLPDLIGLPHPAWFVPCYLAVFPLAAYLAGWLVVASTAAPA